MISKKFQILELNKMTPELYNASCIIIGKYLIVPTDYVMTTPKFINNQKDSGSLIKQKEAEIKY